MDTSLSNYTDRMKVTVLLFVVLIYYIYVIIVHINMRLFQL